MNKTFFFYDLETSGRYPRTDRIMQFAGQRTDMNLEPIGEPVNILVKLPNDTLPSPIAISITGITPQSTQADGLTEAEFCKFVTEEVFIPNTIAVGYNSIRFDDEFMRHVFWRNFYDPYEWQWKDGRSKWDLLDVVRMTRALRPEGIEWPVSEKGKATNRLELITKMNGISHEAAHDAMSDVNALIDVTKLIREKQPKLFDFLLKVRDKKEVIKYVNLEKPQAFVYSSGRYSSEHNKTTVVFPLATTETGAVLVYDLRYNLNELKESRTEEDKEKNPTFYPVFKELRLNRCPAVAPLSVLDQDNGWKKIGLEKTQVEENLKTLLDNKDFVEKIHQIVLEKPEFEKDAEAEMQLYDGFLNEKDIVSCAAVRKADKYELSSITPDFQDPRLTELFVNYKGRNYPETLNDAEREQYENYRMTRIKRQQNEFIKELQMLAEKDGQDFIIEELQLWFESILS